jgi:hypothetical protein
MQSISNLCLPGFAAREHDKRRMLISTFLDACMPDAKPTMIDNQKGIADD